MTITPADIHSISTQLRTVHQLPDMVAELALPEQLVLADRCDRCGAQALHAFAHEVPGRGHVVLLFCNHHGRAHHRATHSWAAHHDYRMPMDEWEKQAEEQVAKAQRDNSGKTDPHPPTPRHLAQWDLDMWA